MLQVDDDKNIYIINSLMVAMAVSIATKGKPINVIFEKVEPAYTDYSVQMMKNFAHACINIRSEREISTPNSYYLQRREGEGYLPLIKRMCKFRKEMDSVFHEDKDAIYIGPGTSSIMNSLRCRADKIYYIYHGDGDYLKYYNKKFDNIQNVSVGRRLRLSLRNLIIGKIVGLPNIRDNGFICSQGISMVDLHDPDNIIWANYEDFQSDIIEARMKDIANDINSEAVIVSPISAGYTSEGLDTDLRKFDERNLELITRHIPDGKDIYLKFHYSVYSGNERMIDDLKDYIEAKSNHKVYDITDYIPDEIGGKLLPLELVIKYCGFHTLLAVTTATAWNMYKSDVKKIFDLKFIAKELLDGVKELHVAMRKMGVINNTFDISC